MKLLYITLIAVFSTVASALIDDVEEDCMVINPLSNTIVTAGEKMKIAWRNSHAKNFTTIYMEAAGLSKPIIIAENVPTSLGHITVVLPTTLIPSNEYYMTLGTAPYHCKSGNLRVIRGTDTIPDPKPLKPIDNPNSPNKAPTDSPVATSESTHANHVPIIITLTLISSLLFHINA